MNWGKGITIGLATFMGFILFLVISLMRHDVDLVSDDYYQQELHYEDQITAQHVYAQSAEKIDVNVSASELQMLVPQVLASDSLYLQFRRPDNKALDMDINLPGQQRIAVPLNKLKKGNYEIIIRGRRDSQPYLFRETVTIP